MTCPIRIALACLGQLSAPAWSAPITFNTALPVRSGGWVLREQAVYLKAADDPSPARRDLRVAGVVSVLGYGVSRDFALFAMLPWSDKRLDERVGSGSQRRSARGVGDLTLLARYSAYERNAPGRTFRVAPFAGVKAPTGRSGVRDGGGRLPPPLQPGSGAWDVLGGVVATWQTLDVQFDGQLSYLAHGRAHGRRAGNIARLDASMQYRVWPRALPPGVPAFVYGVLEASLVHAARDRVDVGRDRDSGGTTLLLSPGVQYVTKKWIVEAGIQIPAVQKLNGDALGQDYGVTAGFRVNF